MKVLLVVDLQREFYSALKYEQILKYIAKSDYDVVIGTIMQNTKDSPLARTLNWGECFDVVPDSIEYEYDKLIVKNTYSVPIERLSDYKDAEITVIGCDADACVLATCFNLFDNGFNFKVDLNYVYTTGNINLYLHAKEVMKRNFGKCVIY